MKIRAMIPLLALAFAPAVATAGAEPAQGTWTAWYGCWRAVESDVPGQMLCVLPGGDATAARMVTYVDGAVTSETVVRADGVDRPVEEGGCSGSERAFFSHDGRRVFTRAALSCGAVARVSTGVIALISEVEWVDARGVSVAGQEAARSVRYRAVGASEVPPAVTAALPQDRALAQEAARLDASAPLDLDDVVEAARVVSAPALEALLAARQSGFGLDARRLVLLRDAGVAPSTIDVMVALSYPQRFAVRPPSPAPVQDAVAEDWPRTRDAWNDQCYDPHWTNRRYRRDCYDRYGYGDDRYSRYGYSPWGYDPFGWQYTNRPIVVITRPDGDDVATREGAVVKGRGYTRTGSTSGSATPRDDAATGSSRPSNARPATTRSPDSGRSSDKERSSGSGSSDSGSTGRTAKPRGGGN